MTPPYYTVTVSNVTRGWSYSVTHDDTPDKTDPVILADPFRYVWGFENEQIPARRVPDQASFALTCLTAAVAPVVERGDRITLEVRVGTSGPFILNPPAMRVTDVDVELFPQAQRRARLSVTLVDSTVDLATMTPVATVDPAETGGPPRQREFWLERIAEIAYGLGRPLGCPSSWAGDEGDGKFITENWSAGTGAEQLERVLNAHAPGDYRHVVTPGRDTYPTGYERAAPTTWAYGSLPDPIAAEGFSLVPADRNRASGLDALPLRFGVVSGVLSLVPNRTDNDDPALNLAWCTAPAKARKSRDHVTNYLTVNGFGRVALVSGEVEQPFTLIRSSADAANGPVGREINTDLIITDLIDYGSGDVPVIESFDDVYFSDPSALDDPWTYDGFTLRASMMPDDDAEALLPYIPPRYPGDSGGDGQIVRHVTLFNPDPGIRFGALVAGFITGGVLTIARGDLTFDLTTTPGDPIRDLVPDPFTVAHLEAASYAGHPAGDIDPLITIADLVHVAA